MTTASLDVLINELTALLLPIKDDPAADSDPVGPRAVNRLLAELGVVSTGDDPLAATLDDPIPAASDAGLLGILSQIVALEKQIQDLIAEPGASLDTVARALDLSRQVRESIASASSTIGSLAGIDGFGRDLLDLLLTRWLCRYPLLRSVAALLTLVRPYDEQDETPPLFVNGALVRLPFRADHFQFGRLVDVLHDPLAVLRAEYANTLLTEDDAAAVADKLFPRLANVLNALGISAFYGINPINQQELGDAAPIMARSLLVYTDDPFKGVTPEAGFVVTLSPASQGDLGVVISPFGTLTFSREVGNWTVAAQITAGVDVAAWGRHGLTLLADVSTTEFIASISATLPKSDDGPAFVLGAPDGTRLEVGSMRFGLDAHLSESKQSIGLSADFTEVQLVLAPGDGDGFLGSILPAGGARAKANLGITWSNTAGLTFRGSASLDETLPINVSIGPVSVPSLHVTLAAADGSVRAELSASVSASIGPVRAIVDRLGIAGTLTFPDGGGSLGFADLALGLQPPSKIGLSIDAGGAVAGGGFLSHDATQGTYAGVLQLTLHETLTLTAVGLIATRMPDGSRGFSLLVFITAEDFNPIQLGLGFTLQAIGGLVAINRTFDTAVLRAGLKDDTLKTLLFPKDPVANAVAIVQALERTFPARRGSYLVGLLARITWFTPTVIQLDLGLVLEFGGRTRLLVLGRVSALLPSADNDLVRLVLDTVGELDFDAGTLAVDAVLVDSRLAHRFPITGAAALRARWGKQQGGATGPNFVLAIGGFNPRFAAPAGFPSLERVAIALSQGKNPRLVCEAYFAITSNTLQFGARASLYAEAAGFSVSGEVGFDALLSWSPLHFVADFLGMVQLKRGSHTLFKLSLSGTLEGPQPLRLSGKLTFEILWMSFTVRIDATLSSGAAPAGLTAVAVADLLTAALGTASNWRTQVAPGVTHGVALRAPAAAAGGGAVLDPLGQLVVEQQVVPLNLTRDVDTYGGAPVAGARRFALTGQLNETTGTPLQGAFAPARYFTMGDDAKLVAPSFSAMDAGLVLGDATVRYAAEAIVSGALEYEPITLNPPTAPSAPVDPTARYPLPAAQLQAQAATGAAARAPVRQAGRARFRNPVAKPAATVAAPAWRIVRASDGAAAPVDPSLKTWSEQRAALDTLNRGGATWVLVPTHELVA